MDTAQLAAVAVRHHIGQFHSQDYSLLQDLPVANLEGDDGRVVSERTLAFHKTLLLWCFMGQTEDLLLICESQQERSSVQ